MLQYKAVILIYHLYELCTQRTDTDIINVLLASTRGHGTTVSEGHELCCRYETRGANAPLNDRIDEEGEK